MNLIKNRSERIPISGWQSQRRGVDGRRFLSAFLHNSVKIRSRQLAETSVRRISLIVTIRSNAPGPVFFFFYGDSQIILEVHSAVAGDLVRQAKNCAWRQFFYSARMDKRNSATIRGFNAFEKNPTSFFGIIGLEVAADRSFP